MSSPQSMQELRAALDSPNVRAFLVMVRAGEGTADMLGYSRLFGGGQFRSFDDHPRAPVIAQLGGKRIVSSAAGAYQFLSRTWDECRKALQLPDFSPVSQDLAAVFLIARRGALDDVRAGRLTEAITKCAAEWASLPGSIYGQPTRTMAQALATYTGAGGTIGAAGPEQSTKEPQTMLPLLPIAAKFVSAALPSLVQAAPALIRIFGSSPRAEQNANAAQVVADIAKEATGEPTVEGAVQAIQDDPAKATAFREAVHANMGELIGYLMQAQEADDKSRGSAVDRNLLLAKASRGRWLWLLGLVALIVVGMSYWITWGVLFNATTFSDETKAMLLGQIVILGFVTVLGFLFGSSISSRLKDEREGKP